MRHRYRCADKILKYKEKHRLSYRQLAELLGCETASLYAVLNRDTRNLALQIIDEFDSLVNKEGAHDIFWDAEEA